jgi:hypothetical protein
MKSRRICIYSICLLPRDHLNGLQRACIVNSCAHAHGGMAGRYAARGQPAFPALGQYWIIDDGCSFDLEKVKIADAMFEKLRTDGIAEVAVVCQTGIVDKGGTNDDKIWLRDWARWAKMGSVQDSRAVVWLIRPDVKPTEQRVAVEISRWLYWYTAIDYADGLTEAANYANAG